jgi:hypothetical protein
MVEGMELLWMAAMVLNMDAECMLVMVAAS